MLPLLGLLLASAPASADAVWTLVLPFGVPQFTHDRPGRGALYLGSQLALGGLATWSSIELYEAAEAEDFDREIRHRMISAGAVAGVSASWLVSVIDGARLHQIEIEGTSLGRATWPISELPASTIAALSPSLLPYPTTAAVTPPSATIAPARALPPTLSAPVIADYAGWLADDR